MKTIKLFIQLVLERIGAFGKYLFPLISQQSPYRETAWLAERSTIFDCSTITPFSVYSLVSGSNLSFGKLVGLNIITSKLLNWHMIWKKKSEKIMFSMSSLLSKVSKLNIQIFSHKVWSGMLISMCM